jgi:ATP-dependent RNA helicase CshB
MVSGFLTSPNDQLLIASGEASPIFIDSNVLKIHDASMVIIDEADMIFEEKEILEVDKIMGKIQGKPQFLIFSATIPNGLRHFLRKYLEKVKTITLKEKNLTTENIEHLMLQCKAKQKEQVLLDLLKLINPFLAIIFVNSKEGVDELSMMLAKEGYRVGKLHGAMEDRARKQMIKRINSLEFQYIVASDIAARGIDIQGVSHVINFDLPKDIEFYIHRTGRTARHNNTGYAYSLYAYQDDGYVKGLQAKGLQPKFVKISNNEIVESKFFVKKEQGFVKTIESEIHAKTKMPKKVKPGYKKKRMEEINKQIKKAKKAHISEIYKKRAKQERGSR